MTLDDIRKLYPDTEGLSDHEVINQIAAQTNIPVTSVADQLGYNNTGGFIRDTGIDLAKGVGDVAQLGTGLANLATGGGVPNAGNWIQTQKDKLNNYYSDARQDSDTNIANTHGFVDTAKAYLQNPRSALGGAIESAPSMLIPMGVAGKAGGAILEGAMARATAEGLTGEAAKAAAAKYAEEAGIKGATNAAASAAWGGVSAAQSADESMRQNPNDTSGMYAKALGTGLVSGALTHGFSLLPGGGMTDGVDGGLGKRIGTSVANQAGMMASMNAGNTAVDNAVDGKPLTDNIGGGIASGLVSGAVFGLYHGAMHGSPSSIIDNANPSRATGTAEGDAIASSTPALSYNPDPMVDYPDGSRGRQSERDQMLAQQAQQLQQHALADSIARPATNQPLPDVVNQSTGVSRPPVPNNVDSMQAALQEPTALRGQDPQTGIEHPIDNGQLTAAGVNDPARTVQAQTNVKAPDPLPFTEAERQAIYNKLGAPTDNVLKGDNGQPLLNGFKQPLVVGQHFNGSEAPSKDGKPGAAYTSVDKLNAAVAKAVAADKLDVNGAAKGQGQLVAEQKFSDAFNDFIGRRPTAKEIQTAAKTVDLHAVTSNEQLIGHIDNALLGLEAKKSPKPETVKLIESLNAWRTELNKQSTVDVPKPGEQNGKNSTSESSSGESSSPQSAEGSSSENPSGQRTGSENPSAAASNGGSEVARPQQNGVPTGSIARGEKQVLVPHDPNKMGWQETAKPITIKQGTKEVAYTPQQVSAKLKAAPEKDKQRIRQALGLDKDGHQVGNPMTHQQIAEVEGVDKSTITKSLAKYGINDNVINRMTATNAGNHEIEELSQAPDSGIHVIDTAGHSDIVDHESAKSKQLQAEADKILASKEAPQQSEAEKRRSKKELEKLEQAKERQKFLADEIEERRRAEAAAARQRGIDEALRSPYAKESISVWDGLHSDGIPDFHQLTRAEQADWISRYEEYKHGDLSEKELRLEQRDLERQLDRIEHDNTRAIPAGSSLTGRRQDAVEEGRPRIYEGGREFRSESATDTGSPESRADGAATTPRSEVNKDGADLNRTTERSRGDAATRPALSESGRSDLSLGGRDSRTNTQEGAGEHRGNTSTRNVGSIEGDKSAALERGGFTHENLDARIDVGGSGPQETGKSGDIRFNRPNVEIKIKKRRTLASMSDRELAFKQARPDEYLPDLIDSIDDVRKQLEDNGLEHVMDIIHDWHTDNLPTGTDGVIEHKDGNYEITISNNIALGFHGPQDAADVIHHELAHAVDDALNGGVYSAQPEMKMYRDSTGKMYAIGEVSKEVMAHFRTGADQLAKHFEYPLDAAKYPDDNRTRIQMEVFAQMWTAWHSPELRSMLEEKLPITSKYLSEVEQNVKSTSALQRQTDGSTTGERRKNFKARNTIERVHSDSGSESSTALYSKSDRTSSGHGGNGSGGNISDTERVEPPSPKERNSIADKAIQKLPYALQGPTKSIYTSVAHLATRGAQASAFMSDLSDWAAKHGLPAMKQVSELFNQKGAYKTHLDAKLGDIAERVSALPQAQQSALNEFLHDSTYEKKWGFEPSYKDNVTVDPGMEARFKALDSTTQDVAKSMFEHANDMWKLRQSAIHDVIQSDYTDRIAKAEAAGKSAEEVNKMWDEMESMAKKYSLPEMDGPYVPLKRFGNYVVVGKSDEMKAAEARDDTDFISKNKSNADHNYLQYTSSMGEANRIKDELLKDGKYGSNVYASERDASEKAMAIPQHEALMRMAEQAKVTAESKSDQNLADAMHKALREMVIQSLGEANGRSSELTRKYIPGVVKQEMSRAFFTQGFADNQFVSGLKHNQEIEQHVGMVRTQVREGTGDIRKERQNFLNELQQRRANALNMDSPPWVNEAMRFTSVWRLLTSPAYYLQYLSQPITMALPKLQGRHGYVAAASAMRQGLSDGRHVAGLPMNEQKMVQALKDSGTIGIGHSQEFGHLQSLPDGSVSKVWQKATGALGRIPHNIEMFNRTGSALAAYRLELAKTGDHDAAVEYAKQAIDETYGNYSPYNAPRIMQGGGLTKLMTQFRKFQFIHGSLLIRAVNQALRGESPEVRKAAGLQLAYMSAHYGVLAGALGIPGAHVVAGAIQQLFGDPDSPEDTKLFIRRHTGNGVWSDLLLGGVPKALGLDVSNRTGAGDIFSPFRGDVNNPFESKKDMLDWETSALGPFLGGMLPQTIDGMNTIRNGDYYRGLEKILPSGISDLMKAGRYADEGVSNKRGDITTPASGLSALDIVGQALGAKPNDITTPQEMAGMAAKYTAHYKDKANEIKFEYTQARKNGDSDAAAKAMAEWQKMQESQRSNGFKPDPLSTLLKSPMEQAKRERMTMNGNEYTKKNMGFFQQAQESN